MKRKRAELGRNPALLRLETQIESIVALLRTNLRPTIPVSMEWRQKWAEWGESKMSMTSWRNAEAKSLVKGVLRAAHQVEELALALTAAVNEKKINEIDKPDSLVEQYARSFVEDNRLLIAEVVLSGGDE